MEIIGEQFGTVTFDRLYSIVAVVIAITIFVVKLLCASFD